MIGMKKQIGQAVKEKFKIPIIAAFLSVNLLTGCVKNEASDYASKKPDINQETMDKSEEYASEIKNVDKETQTASADGEELSYDAMEIQNITEKIFAAFFKGDSETMETYMLDTEGEAFEPFPNAGEETSVPEHEIKGLGNVGNMNLDDTFEIWCEFKTSPQDDYFQCLTITFIKKEEGWKVQSVGLEM